MILPNCTTPAESHVRNNINDCVTGATRPVLHTRVQRRGQKPAICTREEQCEGRRGQKGWFCPRGLTHKEHHCRLRCALPTCVTPTAGQPRRNSLRVAPFGPPTVSCVLAHARTCIRQAPPTFRGRGLATPAVAARLSGFNLVKSYSSFYSRHPSFVFSQKTLHLCTTELQNS